MRKSIFRILIVVLSAIALNLSIYSQTTSISYQGSLEDEGSPANGNYNFAFRLYDSGTFGNQLGNELSRTNVPVTDGIFTVNNLDFGTPFTSTTIWLEIDVRKGIIGSYTTLSPRQRVTSSPTSLRSLIAGDSERFGGVPPNLYVRTNDPNFVRTDDARLTDSRSPTSGSSFYIQNRTSEQSSSNFRISGTGRANRLVATSNLSVGSTSFSNPFVAVGNGTDVGGVNGINNVVARFRSQQSNEETAISLDTASGEDSIVYFAKDGVSEWQIRHNVSEDELSIRKQTGTASEPLITFGLNGDHDRGIKIGGPIRYPEGTNRGIFGPFPSLCIVNDPNSGTFGLIGLCPPSSIRYKKNVENYSPGIELVRKLRPVTFNYKQGGLGDFGLIAEEVAELEPYLALFDRDKRVNGIRYDRIGVVLINAINEQQDEIERLHETIEKQRTEFEALRSLVCSTKKDAQICQK